MLGLRRGRPDDGDHHVDVRDQRDDAQRDGVAAQRDDAGAQDDTEGDAERR